MRVPRHSRPITPWEVGWVRVPRHSRPIARGASGGTAWLAFVVCPCRGQGLAGRATGAGPGHWLLLVILVTKMCALLGCPAGVPWWALGPQVASLRHTRASNVKAQRWLVLVLRRAVSRRLAGGVAASHYSRKTEGAAGRVALRRATSMGAPRGGGNDVYGSEADCDSTRDE